MVVALQFDADTVAAVPLNVTVLEPCDPPKLVPEIVTEVPTRPEVGLRVEMFGPGDEVTVNVMLLLATPPTVTTTGPVVAPVGTGTTILVSLQLVGVPAVPLNVTVLDACVAPNLLPMMVTGVLAGPDETLRPEMYGALPPPPPP